MSVSKPVALAAALLVVLGLPLAAGAKEESKIQVPLVDESGPGNGKGRSDGKLLSKLTEHEATFQVHVKKLVAGGSYELRARDLEATDPLEGELIQAFTADSSGQANFKVDLLQTGDAMSPPRDPRGKLISVYDVLLGEDVFSGWLYGDVANDTPHTKVKESTELEPASALTEGTVRARYDLRPNGKGRLDLQLKGLAAGSYEIHVDSDPLPVETLTTNPGGNAKLSLRTHPGKGNGGSKGNNKKGTLSMDPRRKLIEVKQGGVVVFSGPMLAQIPNLNDCEATQAVTPMLLDPGQPTGAGEVTTGVDESCDPLFAVSVSGLAVGDYSLLVDTVDVGTALSVTDDGMGGTAGELRFDANPEVDDPDELPLDFAVQSGSLVEVKQGATLFLSVTLP